MSTEALTGVVGDRAYRLLVALYIGAIVSANALAAKLFVVEGVSVTAGALAIPIVYLSTDIINELYGQRVTRQVVWMGLVANVVLAGMAKLCVAVPSSQFGVEQAVYEAVFDVTPRVVVASMLAYLMSSLLDVWLFAELRWLTGGRYFWLRKNGSTFVSQLVDSYVFVILAFGGVIPWAVIPGMAFGQYLVKIIAAPLGTPLSYAAIRLIRRGEEP